MWPAVYLPFAKHSIVLPKVNAENDSPVPLMELPFQHVKVKRGIIA